MQLSEMIAVESKVKCIMHNSVTTHTDVLSNHTENAVAAVQISVAWKATALELQHQKQLLFFQTPEFLYIPQCVLEINAKIR